MKNKILIPITIIVSLLIVSLAFFFPKNKYIVTWKNNVLYNDIRINTVIKMKNNGKVSYTKTYSEGSETWFESIKEEYGSFFEIKEYEIWYNEDNANLMEKGAEN